MKKEHLENKVNSQITSNKIRIVNLSEWTDDSNDKVITNKDAKSLAREFETDLIEIAYNANEGSSICKLIDVDKFQYQLKKKQKEQKAAQKKVEMKEIKLGVDIAENDINTKHNQAVKFFAKGDIVKVSCQLKGRQKFMQTSKDNAQILLLKFAESLEDVAKVSQLPTWQGIRLIMILSPKK